MARTCDGKTTPAPTARSTRTTFPDEPTFKSSSTRAASTSTIKWEEKERSPGTAITGTMAGRTWMTGKSWIARDIKLDIGAVVNTYQPKGGLVVSVMLY